jgi:hypothetical protein
VSKPLHTGRLLPEGVGKGKPVIQLLVFDSNDDLQEWVEDHDDPRQLVDDVCAITMVYNQQGDKLRCTIGLCTEKLDIGTIVHESLHAAMAWSEWRGVLPDAAVTGWADDNEETIAVVAERLTTQIVKRLLKWKLI